MPGQIKRRQVEWHRASCQGLDTDLFYDHKTGLEEKGLSLTHLRRICSGCPIQRDCLTIGVAHEPYGFWGGLSQDEREHIHAKKTTRVTELLKDELFALGVNYNTVVKFVQAIKRDFIY